MNEFHDFYFLLWLLYIWGLSPKISFSSVCLQCKRISISAIIIYRNIFQFFLEKILNGADGKGSVIVRYFHSFSRGDGWFGFRHRAERVRHSARARGSERRILFLFLPGSYSLIFFQECKDPTGFFTLCLASKWRGGDEIYDCFLSRKRKQKASRSSSSISSEKSPDCLLSSRAEHFIWKTIFQPTDKTVQL